MDLADSDLEFTALQNDFIYRQKAVQHLISRLSVSGQEMLMNYLGAFGAMEHRLVELACFQMRFEDK